MLFPPLKKINEAMRLKKITPLIGTLIISLGVLFSFTAVLSRSIKRVSSGKTELYIGHYFLHTGMREAFTEAIRSYEELHPDVRIIQMAVPQRAYAAWNRTQLIGGSAPDILAVSGVWGDDIPRHYITLDKCLAEPNPYNQGSILEGLPWRDTFFDGLQSARNIVWNAEEVYAITLQTRSTRLFINRDLLMTITGNDELPRSFAQLQNIAAQVRSYSQRTGKHISPIAGSRPYAEVAFEKIMSSQTQRLVQERATNRTLRFDDLDLYLIRGEFSYSETPELRRSIELMREVAQLLSPGFMSFEPEDAIASYLQQRSLMLMASTADYPVLVNGVPFETRATLIPLPSDDDPHFGELTLGQAAETPSTWEGLLAITQVSSKQDLALDFLRYLTSHPTATRFSEISLRDSAIIDIPSPAGLKEVQTNAKGEIPGFRVDKLPYGTESGLFIQRHIHEVIGPKPAVHHFLSRLDAEIRPYITADITAQLYNELRTIQRLDPLVVISYMLPPEHPKSKQWQRNAEIQHQRRLRYQRYIRIMDDTQKH